MAKRKSATKKKPSSSSSSSSTSGERKKAKVVEKQQEEEVNNNGGEGSEHPEVSINGECQIEVEHDAIIESPLSSGKKNTRKLVKTEDSHSRLFGNPVPSDEAKQRWPHRYSKNNDDDITAGRCHYLKAEVDGHLIIELNDHAHVQAGDGEPPYICKVVEIFEGVDGLPYFRAQWYYRSVDTVIKESVTLREEKRVFASEIMDDNPLDCLLQKLNIVRVDPNLDVDSKQLVIPECDYYYDMKYLLPYSTFIKPSPGLESESQSTVSSDEDVEENKLHTSEKTLLDLYCGCGAMSTGLCLGANFGGFNLVTRWAVDLNNSACQSVALNHPETNVRNEAVGDFLTLLKEWQKLCVSYGLVEGENTHEQIDSMLVDDDDNAEDDAGEDGQEDDEIFEVEEVIGICYGDPKNIETQGLYFKIRWKGYGPDEDSWEPVDGLGNCHERIGVFVKKGYKEGILPLPGDVHVICGGPPCQGISGFNRFRNAENPLADPKNEQLVVFMEVVNYLKPKYVLMENVVDLVKFSKGFLGRYALGRLVDMNYQARMGMMAAGAYGLPQFRMRVFIWGAQPSEKLPQYPLPTHDLVLRGVIPTEFEMNTVAYDEGHTVQLENKLFLGDAISDLPEVTNYEHRDEMPYKRAPETDFQRFIRMTKDAMFGSSVGPELLSTLYDHRPLKLNDDDFQRVCQIPKKKGANFRDLPGVRVRDDNKVEWDPDVKRVLLTSGKPLVPDYAMSFVQGTSSKPFGRLWWDETVPTVVTRAEPHNQVVCHPLQDRVLTIRENARLQGFPDYYQLRGTVKDRYTQVGNAVAVPVARALGYALAMASQDSFDDQPLLSLPSMFPMIRDMASSPIVEDNS